MSAEDREKAIRDTGGAHALAIAALDYLALADEPHLHLQVAAHLLGMASRMADSAALNRRREESSP